MLNQTNRKISKDRKSDVLIHRDGGQITFLQEGIDEEGAYLIVEHIIKKRGAINGPHWHPHLSETFTIQEGTMRFLVDKEEFICESGDRIIIEPTQVHQFWNISEGQLKVKHEIRPPGRHREMFEMLHQLESAGKMNSKGIPTNPLWLGLLWETMDGYIVGPPKSMQKFFFGGLAKAARILGYVKDKK